MYCSMLTRSYMRVWFGGVVNSGLEGVVAAVTRLSHVDGERESS
jgi:hypothetical protein